MEIRSFDAGGTWRVLKENGRREKIGLEQRRLSDDTPSTTTFQYQSDRLKENERKKEMTYFTCKE